MNDSVLAQIQQELRKSGHKFYSVRTEDAINRLTDKLTEEYNYAVDGDEVIGFSVKTDKKNVVILVKKAKGDCRLLRFYMPYDQWTFSIECTSDTVEGMAIQLLDY